MCAWLVGCGTDSTLRFTSQPLKIDIARTADPNQVTMLPVQFKVVNKDNLDSFIAEIKIKQASNNPVFFAITTGDYENLAINIADLRRYIEQQQGIILYYRQVTSHMAPNKLTDP
jgi:hypothetical protein